MSQHPVLLRLLDDAVGFRRRPGFAPDHMVTATGSPSALLVLAANPEELRALRPSRSLNQNEVVFSQVYRINLAKGKTKSADRDLRTIKSIGRRIQNVLFG